MLDIIPGIIAKDIGELVRNIDLVAPHVTWVQIDFADGTLVDAKSAFDIDKLAPVIKKYPLLSFEAHLVVADPVKYIRPIADAGFKRLIAHVESSDPRRFLEEMERESVEAGLAIDATTEIEHIEPFLEILDQVLVITGDPFLPETLEKIRLIKESYQDVPIEVAGGIDEKTTKLVKDAGATKIVPTHFLFRHPSDIASAIRKLQMA